MKIDQIIRSKRKTIALIVKRDGSLVVRAPEHASNEQIDLFVEKKAAWIRAKKDIVNKTFPQASPKEFVNGEGFWYLGSLYRLQIVEGLDQPVKLDEFLLLDKASLPNARTVLTNWYKERACETLSERVTWYANKYGFNVKQVKVTSAQKRWGACSSKGTLSFAWRLVMAPVPLIDYVVVHELVHTVEKNHGKVYWGKVKAIMPDYKQKIEWLEINGNILNL